jgi:hypothetical protein
VLSNFAFNFNLRRYTKQEHFSNKLEELSGTGFHSTTSQLNLSRF